MHSTRKGWLWCVGGLGCLFLLPAALAADTFIYDNTAGAALSDAATPCGGAELVRTFNVADDFVINDLNVGFNATHTFRGDIRVRLQSPAGTLVTVMAINGTDGNDNYDLLLDDASANPINDGNADSTAMPFYDRTAQPSNPLAAFNGETAMGTWTITACDNFIGDGGTYNRARLVFDGTPVNACAASEIGGTVFRDYDDSGTQESHEPGIAGITVTAYDSANSPVATVLTAADGSYLLTGLAATTAYRVELTGMAAADRPSAVGTESGTSVQLTTSGTCDASLGFFDPAAYCQRNPLLATNCYLHGDQAAETGDVLVSFPYDAGATGNSPAPAVDQPPPTHEAAGQDIGSTWGLAYQAQSNSLFAASFMKRHMSFGPGGPGAIYRIDRNTSAISLFLDLNALFGAGTAGTDPHPAGTDFTRDANSWDPVAKIALGDLDISEDGQTLWTINLADRRLYRIPIGVPPTPPSAAAINRVSLPLPGDCPSAATNMRPFAIDVQGGLVYVGMVCTAQTTQNVANLRGYVYSWNGSTFTQRLSFPLAYPRGCAVVNGATCTSAAWRPWVTTFTVVASAFPGEYVYPQPILSDIEVLGDRMVIGLRDRFGDQTGVQQFSPNAADMTLYTGDSAGDVLLACRNGSTWSLEANGSCGGTTSAGAGNGEGPGGGEFFYRDNHPSHDEISMGGTALIPGRDLALTIYDPIFNTSEFFDGGILWANASGERVKAYRVYDTTLTNTTFAKGGGLGDLEAMCDLAPLEIGNRVWNDTDTDGVQDADEPGIPGVAVRLVCAGQTATATTDADGLYLFTDALFAAQTALGAIPRGTACALRIATAQGALAGFVGATVPNNGGADANADRRDSDAVDLGGGDVGVAFSTGGNGANTHAMDFGFSTMAVPGTVSGHVFEDTNGNGVQDGGEPDLPGIDVVITDAMGGMQTVTTDAAGNWSATVPAGSTTADVDEATLPAGYVQTAGTDPTVVNVPSGGTASAGEDGYQPPTSTLGDFVWEDLNGDGVQDAGEPGRDGVTVDLLDGGGALLVSTSTAGGGLYGFSGLLTGTYGLRFNAPLGFGFTLQDVGGDDALDSDADAATGQTANVLVNGGVDDFTLDAGLVPVPVCYAIADSDKLSSSDELVAVEPSSGRNVALGSLGTLDVEAAALSLDGLTLYAANGGQLGTVDLGTGAWSALASPFGSAAGAGGPVALTDVDSLSFDPLSGFLYGVHRTVGADTPDLLFRIDPGTGAHVADAFGAGVSYLAIPLLMGLESIDDIAIDPVDGQMYAIANDDPTGFSDRLVRIDKASGAITDVGLLGVIDVEGLTFHNDGTLYASTGADGPLASRDRLYQVDKASGTATVIGPLLSLFEDYESLACLEAGVNTVSGTVFRDDDLDTVHDDPPEPGQPGVTVLLYRDLNDNGMVDGGDVLVQTMVTDGTGNFTFTVAADGAFVLAIDPATLPAGAASSTDNLEEADFMGFGNTDADNDFGFFLTASLGDRVWEDLDGDGIQDAGEPGIDGVAVELLDSGGGVLATTTTAGGGLYTFSSLMPGDYAVRFTAPAGFFFTLQDQGGDEALDSDADPLTGETATVTLGSGADNADLDAGLVPPPTEAVIADFRAYDDRGQLVLAWETRSEIATAGFDLYRLTADGTSWERVTVTPLAALPGAAAGGTYWVADPAASVNASYTYLLEELESSGKRLRHGPFTVRVEDREASPMALEGDALRTPHSLSAAALQRLAARHDERMAAEEARQLRSGPALKILVEESGLYRLTAGEIAERLGMATARVERLIEGGSLALTHRGLPVAWRALGGGAGLLFYGEAITSTTTRHNVYWLQPGRGLLMATRNAGQPRPVSAGRTFTAVVAAEEERLPALDTARDPAADFWYWARVISGHPTAADQRFTLRAEGLATGGGEASLEVRLAGATVSGRRGEHQAEIRLNGSHLGTAVWTGTVPHTLTVDVPLALLQEGDNEVMVSGLLAPGVPFSLFYVDGFTLRYPRRYATAGPAFTFPADGRRVLTVSGLPTPQIEVYEITDPRRPAVVLGAVLGGVPGAHTLSFETASPAAVYLLATADGQQQPAALWSTEPSTFDPAGSAYLVITDGALLEASERLADHRRGQGLSAQVVTVEAVMDAHNHGIYDPQALRRFLRHARATWAEAPRYVVLAGEGSYDYRDLLGLGDNLVPPLLTPTAAGLFATDAPYADVMGEDGIPELAVGRLPVLTAAELDAYVDKLIAAEAGSGAAWTRRALMLADDPDAGGAFPSDSAALASRLPTFYSRQAIDLASLPLTTARSQLFATLGEGAGLVTYLGHGGLDRLADEGLLRTADVPTLANQDHLPIVVALTCAVNRFGVPGFSALGQVLVRQADGGALAVWAPVGLSQHRKALTLGKGFLAGLDQDETVGEAIRRGLTALAAEEDGQALRYLYNLLGDPAAALPDKR